MAAAFFLDPHEISLREWEAALAPGYRFDYGEGRLHVTVEIVSIERGEMVQLELRVVDDAHSRPEPPKRGDTFTATYRPDEGPFYVWMPFAEGHFARYAEWRKLHG